MFSLKFFFLIFSFLSSRVAKQKNILFLISSCEELLAFPSARKNPSFILTCLRRSTAPGELSESCLHKRRNPEVIFRDFWKGTEELCFYYNLLSPLFICKGLVQLSFTSYNSNLCRMLSICTTKALTSKIDSSNFQEFSWLLVLLYFKNNLRHHLASISSTTVIFLSK